MKHTKLLTALIASSMLIVGCGGGGGDDTTSSTSTASALSGKVIDGYVVGATVFLDMDYDGELDVGEPNAVTTDGGDYSLPASDDLTRCMSYAPLVVDVPVGAVDEEFGTVTEAYQMVTPPAVSSFDDDEIKNVTPLTTFLWGSVQAELATLGDDMSCDRMIAEEDMRSEVAGKIEEFTYSLASHYNVAPDKIYADFVADNNTALHSAAVEMVDGLKKSYDETYTLQSTYPGAYVRVNYLKGRDIDGTLNTSWYRIELVWDNGQTIYKRYLLDDNLDVVEIEIDSVTTEETTNSLVYTKEIALERSESTGDLACAVNETIMTDESVATGVQNNASFAGTVYSDCETGDIASNISSQRVQRSTVSGDSEILNSWFYNDTYPSPVDLSTWIDVADSLNSLSAATLRSDLSTYSTDFYDETDNGAYFWDRNWLTDEFQFMHTSDDEWWKKTYNDDGTYVLECGTTENNMTVQASNVTTCTF